MDATKRNALCTELCSLVKGQTHEVGMTFLNVN